MRIVNYIHTKNKNTGDIYSAPIKYFSFPGETCIKNIFDDRVEEDDNGLLIIGGGGIFINSNKEKMFWLKKISELKIKKIIWGAGTNLYDTKNLVYPSFINNYDLVGLRDINKTFNWVPCSSCMHPILNSEKGIEYEIAVYEHFRYPLPIQEFPKLQNNSPVIEDVINFMLKAEIIITNSYHGMYWATLLKRKVIAIPFTNRFYHFKYNQPLSDLYNWRSMLNKCNVYPEALEECRNANIKYYKKVLNLI